MEEYISIVLSNSVYPEVFPVRHEFTFDPATAELSLRCLVPGPDKVPTTKAYKYAKGPDQITEVAGTGSDSSALSPVRLRHRREG